ncbi:MAG: class I SAM-dependent methyltransferase [Acidimicrobiales bacterium]
MHDELGTGGATRLLDAGCGSGLALQIAAGRGAEVAGIDASAGMLTIARERNPDADLHEGDLDELPWDDDRFDAVTAFNSVLGGEFAPASDPQRSSAVGGHEGHVLEGAGSVVESFEDSAVLALEELEVDEHRQPCLGPTNSGDPGGVEGW